MAQSNFDLCLEHVLKFEGGYVNDPRDPGGETNMGISRRSYPNENIKGMTRARAAVLYRRDFWDKVRGDDLPAGLDLIVFDAAVNSGPARGARWLQQALGVTADGKIGPQTIAAAQAAHRPAVIERALSIRLAFLRAAKNTKTGAMLWPTYGRGWTRRVESVRGVANAMATATRPAPRPQPVAGIPPAVLIAAVVLAVAAILIFA